MNIAHWLGSSPNRLDIVAGVIDGILTALTLAVLLGIFGALLAWSTFGSPVVWAIAMMGGGVLLTVIGVQLDIVG